MLLIAESGSTKTDWKLITPQEQLSFKTIGFNPYHIGEDEIVSYLNQSELLDYVNNISEIYFYGSGCSTDENKNIIHRALEKIFNRAEIEVEHDLMAAARAACGRTKGMVAILGTGSNTCIFNGENITHNISALGYILGDEGSGVCMGKELIKSYLNNELPVELNKQFEESYPYRLDSILNKVYKEPLPNEFLAQFTYFIKKHEDNEYIAKLIEECFHEFFKKHVCKYPDYKIYELNLIGSIANVFREQLLNVAQIYGVKIGKVIQKPIDELVRFHTA